VLTFAQESIVWEEHTLGLAQAILVAWQSGCVSFAQDSIARGQYPLGLAQADLDAWQSDCIHFYSRIDCL